MLGAACGALGVWLLHLRHAYAAESLAHAMLPGLVLAALVGAPLLLGAARRRARRRGADRARRARHARRLGDRRRRHGHDGVRPRRACSRSRPTSRRGSASCCSATCSATSTATSSRPARSPRVVALALAAGHRPLAVGGLRPGRGAVARRAPGARRARAAGAAGGRRRRGRAGPRQPARLRAARRARGGGDPARRSVRAQLAARPRRSAPLAGVLGLVASAELDVAAGASVALAAVALYARRAAGSADRRAARLPRPAPLAGRGARRRRVGRLSAGGGRPSRSPCGRDRHRRRTRGRAGPRHSSRRPCGGDRRACDRARRCGRCRCRRRSGRARGRR